MGPLEWVLNTPSHHRVHHGANPRYIDKNHGGTLIIWDRLFNTFQKEEDEVIYGITKPLASWNPVWANLHYWSDLMQTARKSHTLRDKINVFIMPPGWYPDHLGGMQQAPEIDKGNYAKYSPEYSVRLNYYIIFQFLIALGLASFLLFFYTKLTPVQLTGCTLLVILTLTTCGALLEQAQWVRKFELARILIWISLPFLFSSLTYFGSILFINGLPALVSLIWFYRMKN